MQKRRVTAPDGTKWIVGRRWLLHRPRYSGFRFGVDKREPTHEPPVRTTAKRKPAPTKRPTPPVVRYTTEDRVPRWRRRSTYSGRSGGGGWIFTGGGSSRGSGGGGLLSRSSGGGSRGSSGGGSRGSSGGGKRGGGGGGPGGAAGAILAALAQLLKSAALIVAVIAAALFTVFVLMPALVFLIQYVAFWVVVGVTIAYRALSGRPWIVEMEEVDGYRLQSWRVVGWSDSRATIDEIAEAVRAGNEPTPQLAEPVEILNAVE